MDAIIVENSLAPYEPRYDGVASTFQVDIPDSNLGNYSSGQVNFNMPSLSTSDGFIDLKACSIQIPIVIDVTSDVALTAVKDKMVAVKAGMNQFIHSVSLTVGNKQVLIPCDFTNIPLTYKMLSESSPLDEANLFDSMGFAKDSNTIAYSADFGGEINNRQLKPAPVVGQVNSTDTRNEGFAKRSQQMAFNAADATSTYYTNLNNTVQRRKNHVVNENTTHITYMYVVDVKLGDICGDLMEDMKLTKGAFLKLVLNVNNAKTVFDIVHATKVISNITSDCKFGGTCPFMVAQCGDTWNTTADSTITVESNIVSAGGIVNDFGMTSCNFAAKFIKLRAEDELEYLSKVPSQTLRYTQLHLHEELSVPAGGTISTMVTSAHRKMRYLLIHTSLADAANGNIPPHASPFTSSPATCMPFSSITNFDVRIANKSIFAQPINYGYDQFAEMRAHASISAGRDLGLSTGLISKSDYDNGYGYMWVDLGRYETDVSDNTLKNLQVRGVNNTQVAVHYRFFLATEHQFSMSTSTGLVEINQD